MYLENLELLPNAKKCMTIAEDDHKIPNAGSKGSAWS